ncbi:hypothetical protein J31TS6_27460 [Brevibacillus reuszeri]|nr:hypothetical protein J31TS6_27460 [Brevibacillus reuszeri]
MLIDTECCVQENRQEWYGNRVSGATEKDSNPKYDEITFPRKIHISVTTFAVKKQGYSYGSF